MEKLCLIVTEITYLVSRKAWGEKPYISFKSKGFQCKGIKLFLNTGQVNMTALSNYSENLV